MSEQQIAFSVVRSDDQELAIEIQGPEGTWRLPMSVKQADALALSLQETAEELRRELNINKLQSYVKKMMVRISSGQYQRGSVPSKHADNIEQPQHPVVIPNSFYISRVLVGQPFFRMLTQSNPSRYPGEEFPVDSVSWFDAITFCNQLSQACGLEPCYDIQGQKVYWYRDHNGYRLPTEAEWEYAARAGKEYEYAGGALADVAWHSGNAKNQVQPLGLKKANSWGLYDMSGLVFEWCWDFMGVYDAAEQVAPSGPAEGTERVCRGGAWNRDGWFARVSARYAELPHARCSNIGFRIVQNA